MNHILANGMLRDCRPIFRRESLPFELLLNLPHGMALSNYPHVQYVNEGRNGFPLTLKERLNGCQGESELQDYQLEKI